MLAQDFQPRTDRWGRERFYESRGRPVNENENALTKWIEEQKISRAEAAIRIGLVRQHLDAICRGARTPNLETAIKIQTATGIPVETWIKSK